MYVVLVLYNLIGLVNDLEALLLPLISANDTQLPRMFVCGGYLFGLVYEVDTFVVSPA